MQVLHASCFEACFLHSAIQDSQISIQIPAIFLEKLDSFEIKVKKAWQAAITSLEAEAHFSKDLSPFPISFIQCEIQSSAEIMQRETLCFSLEKFEPVELE